jgi:hypothetical protein
VDVLSALALRRPLLANLTALPIVNDGTAQVELRFRPVGSGGDWRIDDVYVDPWKGR